MKQEVTIRLCALDSTDSPVIRGWRNEYEIWRWCRQSDLISDVEQAAWFERQSKDPTIKMYKVVRLHGGIPITIGVCGFTSINMLARHAEFSLYIAPEHQGKGFGRASLALLLAHGFTNLGFNQVWGEVISGNPAMKLFGKIGFKLDGVRRHFYWKDGAVHDAHMISMTVGEFNERINSTRNKSGDAGGTDISAPKPEGSEESPPWPVGDAGTEQGSVAS